MKKNFNMVELIVVVVILAVFTTMLLPALSREESVAQKVKCAENLKQWGQNFALYAKDYDDYAGFFTGPRMSSTGYADPLVYHYNKLGYINDPSCTLWNTCPAATLPAPKAFAFLWSYDIFYNPTQSLEGTWEKGKTAQAVVKLSAPPQNCTEQ